MEYWIVYDLASGEELYAGQGTGGSAAYQQLPEGAGLLLVPQAVVAVRPRNLEALKAALALGVDQAAEAMRQRFLSPGAGQAMTYARKEAEARALVAGGDVATPFLSAEAPARGMTLDALATEVIALADAWTAVGSAIEGVRMGAKTRIAAAETLGAIVTAAAIDWEGLLAPAA